MSKKKIKNKPKTILKYQMLLGFCKLGFKGNWEELLRAIHVASIPKKLVDEECNLVMGDYPTPEDGKRLLEKYIAKYIYGGVRNRELKTGDRFILNGKEYTLLLIVESKAGEFGVCMNTITLIPENFNTSDIRKAKFIN